MIRIDAELLSERTSLGQLDRNEAKIAAAITFAHEPAAARAQDACAVEQDQGGELMPPGLFGSTTIDCSACMEKTNTRGTTGATGVVVALEPVSKMAADIIDGRALGGNLRLVRSTRQRLLARANVVDRMSGSQLEIAW